MICLYLYFPYDISQKYLLLLYVRAGAMLVTCFVFADFSGCISEKPVECGPRICCRRGPTSQLAFAILTLLTLTLPYYP